MGRAFKLIHMKSRAVHRLHSKSLACFIRNETRREEEIQRKEDNLARVRQEKVIPPLISFVTTKLNRWDIGVGDREG